MTFKIYIIFLDLFVLCLIYTAFAFEDEIVSDEENDVQSAQYMMMPNMMMPNMGMGMGMGMGGMNPTAMSRSQFPVDYSKSISL